MMGISGGLLGAPGKNSEEEGNLINIFIYKREIIIILFMILLYLYYSYG